MAQTKEYKRAYYLKNRDAFRARYLENQDANKAYARKYYEENKEALLEKQRSKRRGNKEFMEQTNAYNRERYANDPNARAGRLALNARRKWKFSAEFTYEMLAELRLQDCFYCGNEGGTADHLVPKSKGGLDRLDNLVPCCISCNSSKGTSDLQDFYRRTPIAV